MKRLLLSLLSDYGMVLALFLLCVFFSWVTIEEQHPAGAEAALQLIERLPGSDNENVRVAVMAHKGSDAEEFTETAQEELPKRGCEILFVQTGAPSDGKAALISVQDQGRTVDYLLCTQEAGDWGLLRNLETNFPSLSETVVLAPASYRWPNFLKTDNLVAIVDRIVVIAIIAIGMTMVIITAGIDLSVGSLIALSAVTATWVIQERGGAEEAGVWVMIGACLLAVLLCGWIGMFSGAMVTLFDIPPFITTLAMMLVASGLAYIMTGGESVYQLPQSFTWLGRGESLPGVPNALALMLVLYAAAHILMSHTVVGRYIYAVGGAREAARLSGVPVRRTLVFVYTFCGALAGLGGVVQASQLKSGAPTYGLMYELYVIAAVVVGGTSLAGGEGRILGSLIGAFIIAVIQNGMNLTGVQSYTQKVILGLVILGAVMLDMIKRGRGPMGEMFKKRFSKVFGEGG